MFDNSSVDYISEHINITTPQNGNNFPEVKTDTIKKIENLLQNLRKALEINHTIQNSLINKITESHQKMKKIESLLEKVNSIKKSKPKKHMKYPNYIPLESFYFFTPKKTHLYYHLLERVFESNKKDSDKDENTSTLEQKTKMNRYNFSKQHDSSLNNLIFINEKDKIINWYKISAEMNNIFNNNIKNNNNINNNYLIEEDNKNEKEKENNSIISLKDSGVGKSSVILLYIEDYFSDSLMSSIGVDFKTKQIEINDRVIKMQIWDTAGHEKFRTITTSYYKSAHAIIVLYDITDETSFENIKNWMIDIDKFGKQGVLKVLIGNKKDLEKQRKVTREAGESLANKYGINFFEVSAKDNTNIEELFLDTAKCLLEKNENAIVEDIGTNVVLNSNKITLKKKKKCC